MTSDGATKALAVQLAAWVVESTLTAPHPGITVPPAVKLTVPVGVVVKAAVAATVAVKVTGVLTVEVGGEGTDDETRPNVVVAWVTVGVKLFELAAVKLVSLVILAVMVLAPAWRALVEQAAVKVAGGPAALTGTSDVQAAMGVVVPLRVVLKLTLPVGVMPVFGVTATVKDTGPSTVNVPLEVRVKAGATVLTVCVAGVDVVAALKLLSLAMLALTEFEPAASAVVVQVAVSVAGGPAALTSETEVQVAIGVVVPLNVLLKVTLPVGVIPVAGVT